MFGVHHSGFKKERIKLQLLVRPEIIFIDKVIILRLCTIAVRETNVFVDPLLLTPHENADED